MIPTQILLAFPGSNLPLIGMEGPREVCNVSTFARQFPNFIPMISSATEIRVRYAETDMMGVAYHGNYMAWFEVARVNMLDELGCPYRQMETDGFRLPVLEVSVRYRRPLTFDDRATVEAVIKEKPSLRIRIDYTVCCRGEITAEGFTRHAFINHKGQPTRPPASFHRLMEEHFG